MKSWYAGWLRVCIVVGIRGAGLTVAFAAAADGGQAGRPVDAINVVKNGGFEEIEAGGPVSWMLKGEVDTDNAQFLAGAMGLRMRHAVRATSTAVQDVRCGERECLAAVWVKTDGVEGDGACVRLLGPAGQAIAQSKPVKGDNAWHAVHLRFNPGNVGTVTVQLSLAASTGTAWFDDVLLAEAGRLAPLLADAPGAPTRENLALGKPYDLSPPPSYQYCTDPDDDKQLTDGEYTVGYFWTQKSTVGWYLYSPQITIDLGRPEPIDGVMINCPGGGAAGVKFPHEISFLVSDDNELFHEVAKLTPRGLKQDGKSWYTHRFLADGLGTRGRYVMLRLDKAGSTAFADEVEVYRGGHDPESVAFGAPPRSRREMAFAQYGITPDSYRPGHSPEWPHVAWAKPLADGPIKSILMAFSGSMRDAVDLAQRLDLDYVPVQHFSYYRNTTLGGLMQEQIVDALPECQVMIVGGYRWEATPEDLLQRIKERVHGGMGLVCVSAVPQWLEPIRDVLDSAPLEGDQGVLDLVPLTSIPAYHAPRKSHLHLGTYGEGRVAWVNWAEFTRSSHSLLPMFRLEDIDDDAMGPVEYASAVLCRTIQWAAGRGDRRITGIDAAAGRVEVTLSPSATEGSLDVRVRDRYYDGGNPLTASVSGAGGTVAFSHGNHLSGPNYVDVWVRDAQGAVVDFGSVCFETKREASIESVELARPFFAPGEPIGARVSVAGETDGVRLVASLRDTYGRQLTPVHELGVGGDGGVELTLRYDHPLTLCALLFLELRKELAGKETGIPAGGAPQRRAEVEGRSRLDRWIERVWVELPEEHDYTFCAWYAWDYQPAAFHGLRMLEDLGLDTYVSLPGAWRARNAAFANLRHGPENVERVYPKNKDDSLVRVPCLTDPAYRATTAERIEKMAQDVRPYGVLEWSLGDESTLGRRDYCHSPSCLAAFREYVKQRHVTREHLNESWGTTFASWDDVVPATKQEVEGRDRLGQWLDHRAYMETLFADYHAWCGDLIVKHVPEAKVGISGTPRVNASSGHDWWQLMQRSLTHLSGYGGVQRALQRSFMRPGTFYSTFLGYDYKDSDEQRARYSAWDLLFHGANGINYYTLVSNTLNCPMIRPDGSSTNKAPWFFEEARELKAGMGKLFMAATYESDGIAVHYSPPSIHAAEAVGLFDPRDALRNYNTNLSNMCTILKQCQLQFEFVHGEQMLQGKLAGVKLLLLPWSSCVSAAEAEAIARFVRDGGTVLADSYCGVRDEHGAPRHVLDGLFGVKQSTDVPDLTHAEMTVELSKLGGEAGESGMLQVPVAAGVRDLALDGGVAAGQIGGRPACIVHAHGKGRAILVNGSFSNYGQVWDEGAAGEVLVEVASPGSVTLPIRQFMAAVIRRAGVTPAVGDVRGMGEAPDLELSRFVLGEARLLGVLGAIESGPVNDEDRLSFDLGLPRPAHVYESRTGTYLGEIRRIGHSAPRGIARVYALLPYRVDGVSVRGPGQVPQGGVLPVDIRVRVTGEGVGPHIVHVSVLGPGADAGQTSERRHYARNVRVDKGRATTQVALAYNDAPGVWSIMARDVATGVAGRMDVTVIPR